MKILITGSEGQLGRVLNLTKPTNNNYLFCNKKIMDITNSSNCKDILKKFNPDWIINCAAYTAVDNAEDDSENAFLVNSLGPKILCEEVFKIGARLLHISSDFVFNGENNSPYQTDHKVDPLSIYGKSKAEGEKYILKFPGNIILRTGWLYGDKGNNFLKTILSLNNNFFYKGESLKVIFDQIGTPTSSYSLARLCWKILFSGNLSLERKSSLIFHWSDAGVASWYDFAKAIINISFEKGLLEERAKVEPIFSSEFNSRAKRPNYSVLNCSETKKLFNIDQVYWREELEAVIDRMKTMK